MDQITLYKQLDNHLNKDIMNASKPLSFILTFQSRLTFFVLFPLIDEQKLLLRTNVTVT